MIVLANEIDQLFFIRDLVDLVLISGPLSPVPELDPLLIGRCLLGFLS